MKFQIFHLDAFASRLFGGNPAAVVLLDRGWLDDDVLQAVAAENNLSETAFVLPRVQPFPLRWFTPKIEVDLCGHATLAAAHVLLQYCVSAEKQIKFSTRSGELAVSRIGHLLSMDFPARPGKPIPVTDELSDALGNQPDEAYLARDLLAIFSNEAQVQELRPNLELIAKLDAFAVIASAQGEQVDFISRFFAPRAGIPEDPVTGSALAHWSLIGQSGLVSERSKRDNFPAAAEN
jgi:PhzF family phenazine biosynthesis protein